MMQAWEDAFLLLSMTCPCKAYDMVTDGLTNTPADQPEVADAWLQLGHCVNAILSAVTIQ